MDRLRDFLHDNTDIFVALLIAFAMFVVVAVNLGDWFKFDSGVVAADNYDDKVVEEKVDTEEEVEADDKNQPQKPTTDDTKPEVVETPKPEAPKPEAPAAVIVEIKSIVIPNGTPGIGIARILQEKGLINSTSDFTRAAAELKLEGKLRSGTFQIPTDASVEDMVKIISGQRI